MTFNSQENDPIHPNTVTTIFDNIDAAVNVFRSQKLINPECFIAISINIRSINCNFNQFQILSRELLQFVDVIILVEAWLKGGNFPDYAFEIDNFKKFSTAQNKNQNDGVVVYVRNSLECTVTELSLSAATGQQVTLKHNDVILNLYAIYRPPQLNANAFLEDLESLLTSVNFPTINTMLLGDINIDIMKPTSLAHGYSMLLNSHGFLSHINDYTRIFKNQKSCDDHIFTNIIKTYSSSGYIIKCALTDHDWPVLMIDNFKGKKYNIKEDETCATIKKEGNKRTQVNYKALYDLVKTEDWREIYSCDTVETATDNLYSILNEYVKEATQTVFTGSKKEPLKAWVTKGLLKSLRVRDKLKIKLNKNPKNESLASEFKKFRNALNYLLKCAKNNYYTNKLQCAGGNSRKQWSLLKEAAGMVKEPKSILRLNKRDADVSVDNPSEISNLLNDHFVSVGANVADATKKDIVNSNYYSRRIRSRKLQTSSSIFFEPVSTEEVVNFINELKEGTSPGYDNLPAKLLKQIAPLLANPLQYIFNLSLKTGVFPSAFKKSIVIPLFKKGDTKLVTNYRPISLTPCISKVLEKIVKKRLCKFMDKHKILSENQFGFRENRSTQDAVNNVVQKIQEEIQKGKKPILLLLDIEKAFDSISHSKLLDKLEKVGVRGIARNWFESYLKNRKQSVKIRETYSEEKSCLDGLPQGTVLSPLLFLIYVNELCNLISVGKVFSFADDTALMVAGNSWAETYALASIEITKIFYWLRNNQLKLNFSKTNFIAFSPNVVGQPGPSLQIKIHDNPISILSCETNVCACHSLKREPNSKYLGVYLDQHLRWDQHIEYISKKLKSLVYFFKILSNIAKPDLMKKVYFAMAHSVIQYCITVWGSASSTHLHSIEVAQKFILKAAFKKPRRYSTTDLFNDCQIPQLKSTYKLELLKWAIKNNILQNTPLPSYETRGKKNLTLFTQPSKINLTYNNIVNSSILAYNELKTETRRLIREENCNFQSIIREIKNEL